MSPETAQKVKNLANLGNGSRRSSSSGGSFDTAKLTVPNGGLRGGAPPEGSVEEHWRQPGYNGQCDGADLGISPIGSHELVVMESPMATARRPPANWEMPVGWDPLRDAAMLIIDDCTLFRENLAATFVAMGTATPSVAWDLSSLITAIEGEAPSIVLLRVGTRDSLVLLQSALRVNPDVRVIVLGVSEDDESTIVSCAEAGVTGYHLRSESLEDLLTLLRKVIRGESACSPRVSAVLLRRLSMLAAERKPPQEELVLTAREIQILRMLEMGLSNRAIAEELCIAVHTVKNHVHSVLGKLGVNSRAQAVAASRSLRHPNMIEKI
ncbi:hypothetical protein BH09ACT7_BH09ACT7_06300 [soil metagenome]